MNNKKNRFASLSFSLLLAPFFLISAQAQDLSLKSSAADSLAGQAGFANFVEMPQAEMKVSLPEAVKSVEAVRAVSPKPGKDLRPVMQDQARIKAIITLITNIYNGAHLPYSQDGVVFKNKEGRLPAQPSGYYHEYTLLTGSAPHTVVIDGKTYKVADDLSARGSERIIIGGGEHIYYTPDHYANFIEFTMVY